LAPLVGHPEIRDLPLLLEVPGVGDGPRAEDVVAAKALMMVGIELYDGPSQGSVKALRLNIPNAKKTAGPAKKTVEKVIAPAKKTAKKTTAPAKKASKRATAPAKKTAKKTTAPTKKTAKKLAPAKKTPKKK
jgi:hypothetical protein